MKSNDTINKNILSSLGGRPKDLYAAASHLIEHGGKRLRPHMVLDSCSMLGGRTNNAMYAATAIEMIHNFTLIHDDMMDNDELRHGVPTVHNKFGMPVAILSGDVLYSKAFEVISHKNLTVNMSTSLVRVLARACIEVCEGQMLDIQMAEYKKIPSQKEYIIMIQKKTSALFEASCAMGAICANAKSSDVKNLASFGKNLGIAFQITDDLIGVVGDSKITKKPVGNDLREGKKSLPIVLAIRMAKGNDKKTILKAFGNKKASKIMISKAVQTIIHLGVEEQVRKTANQYANRAKRSLNSYSGKSHADLLSLLDFIVERSK